MAHALNSTILRIDESNGGADIGCFLALLYTYAYFA